MNRGFKSPFGIGFAAPNDPRLTSPRIIASQQQAKLLLTPPSIVYESPSQSSPKKSPTSAALPPPLSAVSLTPSQTISQQQQQLQLQQSTVSWPSSSPSISPDTEGSNTAQTHVQQLHLQQQLQQSSQTSNATTLSPSKTTFNSSNTTSTTNTATTTSISSTASNAATSSPTISNQGNARSEPDPMTSPNPLLVSNSDGQTEDDDIQSVIVINPGPKQPNININNLVSPPTSPSKKLNWSPSSSASRTKHNSNINDNINNRNEQQNQPQRPQSTSEPIINNIDTSPKKQTTSNTIDIAKSDDICRSQNGSSSGNQSSFLRMKSRPKKGDRATVLASADARNRTNEQSKSSSMSHEEDKFSTPPSELGQDVINVSVSQSPSKLHNQWPQQSPSHSQQQQPKPQPPPTQQPKLQTNQEQQQPKQQQQAQQPQPSPQSQQKVQLKTSQPEQELQKELQSKQQESTPTKGSPSLSISTPNATLATPNVKTSMKPPRGPANFTPGSKYSASNVTETPFSWDTYLKIKPAEAAPEEAFMQSTEPMVNHFKVGMKLEAKDPRNSHSWCLASVVYIEGPRLKLRFEGSDNTNDFFELIDSENIRAVGSRPGDILLPPTAFRGNLSTYPKFVEKILAKSDIAEQEFFLQKPVRPAKNLFKVGQKLESVDLKNPHLICPATVGEVNGAEIKITFDGWKGPFDYRCEYYSRNIFPINWCARNNHSIMSPKGWEQLLSNRHNPTRPTFNSPNRTILLPVSPLLRPQTPPTKPQGGAKVKKTKTKKKQDAGYSAPKTSPPTPSSSIETNDEFFADTDTTLEDNIEGVKDLGKVSCQRAISIDVWRKSKQQEAVSSSNPARSGPSPSTEGPPTKKARRKGVLDSESDGEEHDGVGKHVNFPEDLISTQGTSPTDLKKPNASEGSTYRHPSDSEIFKTLPRNPTDWTVDNVLTLIKVDETLAKYSNIFECHEIDGKAFVLLTNEVMIKHMGIKIGPVLKIHDLIEQVKRLK